MKKYLLLLCALVALKTNAQSIERQVIGSAGGSFSGAFQLDWTVGEVIVNTATAGSVILTQGFHQPPAVPNSIKMVSAPLKLKAFPVPSTDVLNLTWDGDKPVFKLELYNAAGSLVYNGVWEENGGFTLDLSELSQGIYNLKFSSGDENFSVKVSKI